LISAGIQQQPKAEKRDFSVTRSVGFEGRSVYRHASKAFSFVLSGTKVSSGFRWISSNGFVNGEGCSAMRIFPSRRLWLRQIPLWQADP
jgi:hypothetical protein